MIRKELITDLTLEAGGALAGAHVVYHTSQEAWDGRKPVIWICHALTANSDPEDWWPEMVGPGKAIDTEKSFVACVNMLGSAYGSEGPARENPETGKPWLLDFPKVTVRDMVTASIVVRKTLGVSSVDLLVGSSIGGFQAIEWAVTEPEVFKRCLFIATAPRVSPYLSATVEAQRMALEADPTFREARDLKGGAAGLKCARAQALISYRCFEGYGLTQFEADPDTLFAGRAASYERYQGEKLVRRRPRTDQGADDGCLHRHGRPLPPAGIVRLGPLDSRGRLHRNLLPLRPRRLPAGNRAADGHSHEIERTCKYSSSEALR